MNITNQDKKGDKNIFLSEIMTKIMDNLTAMQNFFSRFKRKKKEKEPVLDSIEIYEDDFGESWLGGEAAAYIFQEEEEKKKKQKIRKK